MKALQWNGAVLQVNEIAVPERNRSEVLLRVIRAGICNTDLEILRGYHAFHGTLGHEFVGIIEDSEDRSTIGQRVVCDINCACHACLTCTSGHPHHCPNRVTIGINGKDGAFAEFLTAPVRNLVPLPASLPLDVAVFAEPVAAALEILEQVPCQKGDAVAIIGDGKLGLLITMCLANYGLDVHLIGHHPERLAVLDGYPVRFYSSLPDRKFALVVEATGHDSGFSTAMAVIAPRGTLVLKSTYAHDFIFNPAPLVVNEITLLGSRCGPLDKAVALLESKKIKPVRLIAKSFPLADAVAAIDHAKQKGELKVLIDFL